MPITEQHVLTHVPKTELLTLLIAFALDLGILDLLHIKRRCFHGDGCDGQNLQNVLDPRKVRLDAVFDGRRKPTFALAVHTVVEARRTITGLAVASGTAKCQAIREQARHVLSQFNLGSQQLFLGGRCAQTDVLVTRIDPQRDRLLGFARRHRQLNHKGRTAHRHGFACPKELTRLGRGARHERLPAHIQHKDFQSILL